MNTKSLGSIFDLKKPFHGILWLLVLLGAAASTCRAESKATLFSSSSGTSETGNGAGRSYDNNTSTRFANNGTLSTAWIQYNIGSAKTVSKVRMLWYLGSSRTYTIKIEVDGVQVWSGATA